MNKQFTYRLVGKNLLANIGSVHQIINANLKDDSSLPVGIGEEKSMLN